MAVSANFLDRRSWAADDLAIEHRSRGVQKMMGYPKSKSVTAVTVAEAGARHAAWAVDTEALMGFL
jgi:hypothetical protein